MEASDWLRGACDFHVHCSPDVVPRVQDAFDLARAAHEAGMAAVGLKDHTTSTVGRCHVLNRLYPEGPRFLSSIVLNPPVGGLNAAAVEAALMSGADIVYFPTYAARHHLDCLGPRVSPVPHPEGGFEPISILRGGRLADDVAPIVRLIAAHDAILSTGHIAPGESEALLLFAVQAGVRRMIVTHASESVPDMDVACQRRCARLGAKIEHSLLAVTPCCPGRVSPEVLAGQIRAVGVEHCLLSSDFGQLGNGPPVAAFARHLKGLQELGFDGHELRRMIVENPLSLLGPKQDQSRVSRVGSIP